MIIYQDSNFGIGQSITLRWGGGAGGSEKIPKKNYMISEQPRI